MRFRRQTAVLLKRNVTFAMTSIRLHAYMVVCTFCFSKSRSSPFSRGTRDVETVLFQTDERRRRLTAYELVTGRCFRVIYARTPENLRGLLGMLQVFGTMSHTSSSSAIVARPMLRHRAKNPHG